MFKVGDRVMVMRPITGYHNPPKVGDTGIVVKVDVNPDWPGLPYKVSIDGGELAWLREEELDIAPAAPPPSLPSEEDGFLYPTLALRVMAVEPTRLVLWAGPEAALADVEALVQRLRLCGLAATYSGVGDIVIRWSTESHIIQRLQEGLNDDAK